MSFIKGMERLKNICNIDIDTLSFQDFFNSEFYKRVSLIYGLWTARVPGEKIAYIPL